MALSKSITYWLVFIMALQSFGQTTNDGRSYEISATDDIITIDGKLNESIWQNANVISDFFQKFPKDSIPSEDRTEVMLARNDKFLYVVARCFLKEGEKVQANTLFRDFPFFQNDAFAFLIDPYRDGLNGFSFEFAALNYIKETAILISLFGNKESLPLQNN
jgi:hypothetical protein